MTMMPLTLAARSRRGTTITLRSVSPCSRSIRPLNNQKGLLQKHHHYHNRSFSSFLSTTRLPPFSGDDDGRSSNSSTTLVRCYRKRRQGPLMLLNSSTAAPRGFHHYTTFGNTTAAGFSLSSKEHQRQQQIYPTKRSVSTWVTMPEVLQDLTIWGGSGWMLQTLHSTCGLEYWSCFAAMSVLIRLALSPFVLQGAHTASRFAKIVPEVQFLVSLFTNDMKTLRANKRPVLEKAMLLKTNLHSLSVLYKLYKIHPLSIFKSPLLQTVCLSYISIDLRKIINGRDPLLAQELVDAGGISTTAAAATSTAADAMIASTWSSWIPATPFPWLLPGDLTEPDPWFGLPVLAGIMMYANIEVSVGRKSLAGPATAKADTGVLIKDIFQSAAILMPCFTCQLPSGIQIYLVTSFVYTMAQSVVLRNEAFRARVGLPAMATSSTTTLQDGPVDPSSQQGEATSVVRGKYAMLFIRLKQLQQKAREIRGKDGPLLGKYVLADNWDISFPGEYRKSSIEVNTTFSQPPLEPIAVHVFHAMATSRGMTLQQILEQHQTGGAFVHGVTAPLWQLEEQQKEWLAQQPSQRDTATTSTTTTSGTKKDKVVDSDADNREVIPDVSDEIMEKANRGLLPVAIKPQSKSPTNVKGPIDLHAKRLQSRGNKKSRSVAGKKRR